MKRCTGTHTMLSEYPNGSFPGLIFGHGDNEKAAREDARNKARAAAKEFCAKKPCGNGGCNWVNYGHTETSIEERSDESVTIIWDITYIECKCKGEED